MAGPSRYDALDARFEKLLEDVQFAVVETELTPAKREARRKLADQPGGAGELAFAKIYFGGIFDAPWAELHHHIAGLQGGKHTVSGHRRSGKSAGTYVIKLIKPLVEGNQGMLGIALRTQDKAIARGEALIRLIKRNRLLQYDYDVDVEQDRAGHWIVSGTHLVAASYSVGLRSHVDDQFKRFRTFIADDLYDRTTVTSELDNGRVVDFVLSEVDGQLEDGALRIVLGNSITETCPIEQLREQFPANHYSFPALDEDGESRWPERFSTSYWEEFRQTVPDEVWLGDYMCRPALKGDYFDPDWLKPVNVSALEVLATVTACDPSRGESPSSCWKALVTASAVSPKSGSKVEVVVQDIYLRREPYDQVFDYVHQLSLSMPAWKVMLFEDDFAQWGYARPYYGAWCRKRNLVLPVVRHSAKDTTDGTFGTDKESRIISLVYPHQVGSLVYAEAALEGKDAERYRIQLLSFGRSREKLDGPDAAATANIMVRRYISTGSFKVLKSRKIERPRWLGGFRR